MTQTIQITCPAIVETQLTGYKGSVSKGYRGKTLEIAFHADRIECLVDGVVTKFAELTSAPMKASMLKLAEEGCKIFGLR